MTDLSLVLVTLPTLVVVFAWGWHRGFTAGQRWERARRAGREALAQRYERQYDVALVDQAARIIGATRVPIRHHTNPHARN